jgi:hypothetical protein
VDSVHNEPKSHGYVVFRIKPLNTLATGDTIPNKAAIYFDYNAPVITKSHLTVVQVLAPPLPAFGIDPRYCSAQGNQKGKLYNPPTAEEAKTTVTLDQTTLNVSADSSFSFDVAGLSEGLHQMVVTYTNSAGVKTTTQSFPVGKTVTPDVDVASNVTVFTDPATSIQLTATAVSGGGNFPFYSFASDRAFTSILQAEGSSNSCPIDGNTLIVGDNWIYVKMKTSATCYTALTNIDSIKLQRNTVTGLFDPDFPSTALKAYPNPLDRQLNITGLSTLKSYRIRVVDLQGRTVTEKMVKSATAKSIDLTGLTPGAYMLSLFDLTRNRPLGAVQLVKK